MDVLIRDGIEADLPTLCALSHAFLEEHCCNGMVVDTLEDWQAYQHISVAVVKEQIVGYAHGCVGTSPMRKSGVCEKGDPFYDLEELYVLPDYRSAGVGRMLFDAQEQIARALGCSSMQLAAVSHDHRRLLSFYESAGMSFWSAWMIKAL